jgi:nucleotide-binding universal stress UspA family protein/predicted RNA-binding Zn-ribbon protein involved in translation (DUF1610 family)
VAALARGLGSGAILFVVVPPLPPGQIDQRPRTGEQEAGEYLHRVQLWLAARGQAARVEVRVGQPAEEILDRSGAADVGWVAISSHGRSGVGRWVYGSVADRVLHQAERPVLLVRPPEARHLAGEPVRARRCHNCGREVYRQTFGITDLCPLCGFNLRACANCVNYDGIVCSMANPWSRGIYAGTPCADFEFRETVLAGPASLGK